MNNIRYMLLFILFFAATGTYAQEKEYKDDRGVFTYVDVMPSAGYDYQQFIADNIVYPVRARERNKQGRIIVKFVVNEDGHISDCSITKGGYKDLEQEALRVVRKFPAWKPGSQNGKFVKVYFTMPIVFKLQ